MNRARKVALGDVVRRAAHPPLGEWRFWSIQAMVVLLAGLHLLVDLNTSIESGALPGGIPVALLVVPVGYAALRFGLAGSAATGLWATVLWLPDLLLPFSEGHAPSDVINLALVDAVAFVFGQQIEAERLAHTRIEEATAELLVAEGGYRQLFETNRAPIVTLDADDVVTGANPAARTLFGDEVVGTPCADLLDEQGTVAGGQLVTVDYRDYRVGLVALPIGNTLATTQLVFEDVTEERAEGRRATRYAALVVAAEEDQRRRLARELHDEPLQLFLHLARRLESLEAETGTTGLAEARAQALAAAVRLRSLARDLRPPALDQLGLVAALSSFLAEVEDETGLDTDIEVAGVEARFAPDVELAGFRIVQEAVRNTVRHARARHVHILVGFAPKVLSLTIADDGRGFVQEEADSLASGHLGLLGMIERSSLLGGHLEVKSCPGKGTLIGATLPGDAHGAVPRQVAQGYAPIDDSRRIARER